MWHVGDPPPHKIPLHHKPTLHMVFVPAKETPSIPDTQTRPTLETGASYCTAAAASRLAPLSGESNPALLA